MTTGRNYPFAFVRCHNRHWTAVSIEGLNVVTLRRTIAEAYDRDPEFESLSACQEATERILRYRLRDDYERTKTLSDIVNADKFGNPEPHNYLVRVLVTESEL